MHSGLALMVPWRTRHEARDVKTLWFEGGVVVVVFATARVDERALGRAVTVENFRPVLATAADAERASGHAMGSLPFLGLSTASMTVVDDAVAGSVGPLRGADVLSKSGRALVREATAQNGGPTVVAAVSERAYEAPPARIDTLRPSQFACEIKSKRQQARTLCFLSVSPTTPRRDAWEHEQGPLKVQLICGKSLEQRLGTGGLANLLKRLKVGQRILVDASPQWSSKPWFSYKEFMERRRQLKNGEIDLRCTALEVLPPEPAPRASPKTFFNLPDNVRVSVVEDDSHPRLVAMRSNPPAAVGLDAEWENDGPAALVQIATLDEVLLLDCTKCKFDLTFLHQSDVVGFFLEQDLAKIDQAGISLEIGHAVELRTHDRQSLSSLVRTVLGAPLDKSQQTANWETQRPMTHEMMTYAALDAYVLQPCRAQDFESTARRHRARDLAWQPAALAVGAVVDVPDTYPKDAALLALAGAVHGGAVVDYNRRAGLVRIRDASVLFVNFRSGSPRGVPKYPNVLRFDDQGSLELTWWPPSGAGSNFLDRFVAEPALLFARMDRQPFVFLGRVAFRRRLDDGRDDDGLNAPGGFALTLADSEALLAILQNQPDRFSNKDGPTADLLHFAMRHHTC